MDTVVNFEKALSKWGLSKDTDILDLSHKDISTVTECELIAACIRRMAKLKEINLSKFLISDTREIDIECSAYDCHYQ